MAFRYRQATPVTSDIIDPEDWNENVREIVGEFNGHLDRDNIPEQVITTAMCNPNTFHSVKSDSVFTQLLSAETQNWVKVNRIEFQTNFDGVVTCEWNGYWIFSDIKNQISSSDANVVSVRIIVNGNEIARMHRSPDSATQDSGYCVGAIDVPAGYLRIETEAKLERYKTVGDELTLQNASGDVSLMHQELVVVHKVR